LRTLNDVGPVVGAVGAAVAQGMADLMDWAMTMASMYGPPPGWEDSWEGA